MEAGTQSVLPFFNDPIVGQVAEKLRIRSDIGWYKYQQRLTRNDLTDAEWINHAQEEALDLANYLERIRQTRMTDVEMVKEFMEKFEHTAPVELWMNLIIEEFIETFKAAGYDVEEWNEDGVLSEEYQVIKISHSRVFETNDVEVLDGFADMKYVINGAAIKAGYDLDGAFSEVHRSNMTKLGPDGRPIKREDGKILKGPNYDPPHLEKFI